MRARLTLLAMAVAGVAGIPDAGAEDREEAHKASLTLSRHYTTNALDSPLALEDWYTVLRGTVDSTIRHDAGTTRISAELERKRFDTVDIENDISAGVGLDTTVAVSDRLELRGTLSARLVEEGDELLLGDFLLGIRTRRTVMSAGLQAGILVAPETALVLEGALSRETPSLTRFEDGLLPPAQLDPVRDRLRVGAKITRSSDDLSYGAYAAAGLMRSDPVGILPELRVADYAAGVHAGIGFDNGATIAASVGLHGLHVLGTAFQQLRPAYEVAGALPLPLGFSLRGMLKAGYDHASNDDPVALWVQRIEAEAGYEPTDLMRLAAGLFRERRDSVALESREHARGFYAEAIWRTSPRSTLTLRMDATRKRIEELDLERRTVDVRLAVSMKL